MKRGGYTMIELLIVLVIMGVLAAAVYPSFHQYVIRARRVEAEAALQQLMQQQERFYTQNNRYLAFSASAGGAQASLFKWWTGNSAPASAYEVEGKACDGEQIEECIQLVATPGTARVDRQFRDDDCQALTLTSTGERLAAGPASGCWP